MQHWFFAFGQLPFEGGLLAVNVEALSVLTGGVEEKPGDFKSEVLVANLEMRALEGEWRTVFGNEIFGDAA